MAKVFVDPRCNIEYSAFYLEGLYRLFEKRNVSFDSRYFLDASNADNLNFVIKDVEKQLRFSVDYNDSPYINQELYSWCTHYGKVNFRASFLPAGIGEKIINMTPSFGIRIWSLSETILTAFRNYAQVKPKPVALKRFLSGYVKQLRHLPVSRYQPTPPSTDYVFSINTLWFSNEWIDTDKTVNYMRLNFYKAVSALSSIRSEIGFVYSQKKNENPVFQEYILEKWMPKNEYLRKTQQSVVVFNTPAWDLCHGWKLAEYLALGKAIISTPFHNELPVPLEHGKHIHVVDGSVEQIQDAVQRLLTDTTYRQNLEQQSRTYYDAYVQPAAVVRYLLKDVTV
ncbi:hypothetical protein GCM10027341_54930 [Spirosoma knui]